METIELWPRDAVDLGITKGSRLDIDGVPCIVVSYMVLPDKNGAPTVEITTRPLTDAD